MRSSLTETLLIAALTACNDTDSTDTPCNCTDGDADTDTDADTDAADTDAPAGTDTDLGNADWSDAPTFVVSSSPRSGEVVDAGGTSEIRVTFSVPMYPGNYAWVNMDDVTQVAGSNPHWDDERTAVIDVDLEPNTTYGTWVNRYPNYTAFESAAGVEALPFALVFKTAAE